MQPVLAQDPAQWFDEEVHTHEAAIKAYSKHHYYGDQPFVGGVTSEGKDGVFAMVLHDTAEDTSFWASKSWFFFDDEVVCLGSDIANRDTKHTTETTIFQTTTGNPERQPYYWNSTDPITAPVNSMTSSDARTIWMMDPYGTGYIVATARGLHVNRGNSTSVTHTGAPSHGYVTAAWLDHGNAPSGADYEYVILPGKTPVELSRCAAAPDYKVLRNDRSAHIVVSAKAAATGYVIFDSAIELTSGIVTKTSAPVLIYEKMTAPGRLHLCVADPDLRMGGNQATRAARLPQRKSFQARQPQSACPSRAPGSPREMCHPDSRFCRSSKIQEARPLSLPPSTGRPAN